MKINVCHLCVKNKRINRKMRDNIAGYIFISLFLIGLFVFVIYPFLASFYYSLTDYNILSRAKWTGLGNYIKMFTRDEKFWLSFGIAIKYAVIQVPTRLTFSLLVAMLLVRKSVLTNVYRAIFYIPSLLGGGVALAITWEHMWGADGAINTLLENIGLHGINWLSDTRTSIYMLILLEVWQFGAQMLIFLAAIKGVPTHLLEAATIDGAGGIRRFFYVTLPMITPALFFNLVNGIINALQSFNSAYLITEGGPMNSSLTFGLYQYRQAFEFGHMGYASAMAWFLMVVIVVLTTLVFKSSSGWVYYQDEM